MVVHVLTVPMRNGNTILQTHLPSPKTSSYRTYEEWKQEVDKVEFTGSLSSYRTYEEWKLNKFNVQFKFQKSSYRTYEEWKLRMQALTIV